MASAGEVELSVVPEASAFGALLTGQISKQIPGMESTLSKLFSGLMANKLALGFALAGAAAVKMASDYEDALAKIEGLVGLTHEETVQLGEDMLQLSKVIPVAPTELAKAMFFIESAGLRGARAMDALEMSAKASAAGLGDIMTIADAVTSAMNSYASSGLTAGEATDVMVAAVREGKLPPEELAGALGQVLPVAAQMKVEFYEVAAAIAAATRQGLSAARAATGVRFLLTAFIKPSSQAVDALAGVHLSIDQLQKQLAEEGLLSVMQTLAKRFDLTTSAGKKMFAQVVGGARGLSVANILIGENADAVAKLTENIKNSAGSTQRAFGVAMETMSNQIKLIVTSLQSFAISIGTVLLPILTTLIHVLGAVLGPVLSLVADHAQLVVTAFLAWIVISKAGALIELLSYGLGFLVGKMIAAVDAIISFGAAIYAKVVPAMIVWIAEAGSLAAALWPITLAIAAIAGGFFLVKGAMDAAHKSFEAGVKRDFQALKVGLDPVNKSISKAAAGVFEAVTHINDAFTLTQTSSRAARQEYVDTQKAVDMATEALKKLPHPVQAVSDAFKAGLISFEQYHDALIAVIGSEAVWAQDALRSIKATGSMTQARAEYIRKLVESGEASRTVEVLQKDLDTAVLSGTISWTEYAHAVGVANLQMNVSQDMLANTATIAEHAAGGFEAIRKSVEGVSPMFDALGLDFDQFIKDAREAAFKGADEFAKFSAKTKAEVTEALQGMTDDISGSINMTTTALQELSGKSKLTAEDILKSFQKAERATKSFGKDLLEISKRSPELARQLAAMGDSGVLMAQRIADASPKMQRKIEEAFAGGETAADKLATKLTRQIAGSLDTIAGILKKLAKAWGIDVNTEGNAQQEIATIQDHVNQLVAHDYEIRIKAHEVHGSPLPSELINMLDKMLTDITEDPWDIKVKASADAGLGKSLSGVTKTLQKISDAVQQVFGEDFPKAYAKDVKAFEQATNDKLKSFNKQMSEMQKSFDKLNAKIKDFKDNIKSGFADASDLISGMNDGIKEAAENMAALLAGETPTGPVVFDPTTFLQNQIGQAQEFAHKLAELAAKGLAPSLLAQLASQGQEAMPLIDALLGGGDELIQQFNDANKTIEKFASATANALSDSEFGGAIKKARKNLNDLSDQIDHFNKHIQNQVEDFINSLQAKRLGQEVESLIQSLNASLRQLGGKVPHAAKGAIVRKPTLVLAGEAGPEAITPLDGSGMGETVNVYLNVEGNAVYSHDLADEVRNILLKDKRYKGTLGLS